MVAKRTSCNLTFMSNTDKSQSWEITIYPRVQYCSKMNMVLVTVTFSRHMQKVDPVVDEYNNIKL